MAADSGGKDWSSAGSEPELAQPPTGLQNDYLGRLCTSGHLSASTQRRPHASAARVHIYPHECSTGALAGMGSRLGHGASHKATGGTWALHLKRIGVQRSAEMVGRGAARAVAPVASVPSCPMDSLRFRRNTMIVFAAVITTALPGRACIYIYIYTQCAFRVLTKTPSR